MALTPRTSITLPGRDIITASTATTASTTTVYMEEKNEYNLTCTARQSFPRSY